MDKMKVFQVPTVYCGYCGHIPISEPCAERVHVTKQLIMRCANRRCLAFDALFKLPIVEQEVEVTGMRVEPDFQNIPIGLPT